MEHFIGYDSVKKFLGKIMTAHLLGLGKVSSAIERQKQNEVTEHMHPHVIPFEYLKLTTLL